MTVSSILGRSVRGLRRRLGLTRVRGLVVADIDGRTVRLDADIGGLEAAASVRRASGGLVFDLPDGAAPSARLSPGGGERGPLIDLAGVRLLRLSVQQPTAASGPVGLVLEATDADGEALGRVSLALSHRRRDWFVALPAGTAAASLRLRFAGQGALQPFALSIVTDPADVDVLRFEASAVIRDVTAQAHDVARDLFRKRDYDRVLSLQTRPVMQSDRINRLALASLVEQREFEAALAFRDRWAVDAEVQADWEVLRLTVLANLGQWNDVDDIVERRLAARDQPPHPEALARAFPFTAPNPALRARLVDRLAVLETWQPAMLDAANRALFMEPTSMREALIARALSDPGACPSDRRMLASQTALVAGDFAGQLTALNAALGGWGLSPLGSIDLSRPLTIDGLVGTEASAPDHDRPLVSVVMTTFNSEATVGYAIRSLLAQTWRRLEVIVVDDAGTDGTVEIVRGVAAEDGRVRILPQASNGGTYVCRNRGLEAAGGHYVLNQDSDDWAHPEKIARLVAAIEVAATVAVFAQALRLSPNEGFQCRNGFVRPDGTSLMFEREQVLQTMGGYDEVRAGADGEFHRRMERAFGIHQIREIDAPLSVVAVRAQSLSRASVHRIDEETGVFTPERNAYRRAYLKRHAERFGRP